FLEALGVEAVALGADAEGGVADEARAGLGVLRPRLAERPGEGDQLLGRHRAVAGVVELLAEDGGVDLERHAGTLGHRPGRRKVRHGGRGYAASRRGRTSTGRWRPPFSSRTRTSML